MRSLLSLTSGLLILAGCPFDPEPPAEFENDSTGTSSGGDTAPTDPTGSTDPTNPTDTIDPSSTTDDPSGPTTDPSDTDDTTCGDGEVNGDEACDDGVNDGTYDGCSSDCTARSGFCGDGDVNGDEMCDEGDANEDGSGCNSDCTRSGAIVGEYSEDGVSFCDGEFVTRPVFREDGNVLVSASGYCNDDTLLLMEVDSDAEFVQSFDDLVLPSTPLRTAIMLGGGDWMLSSSACNFRIAPNGNLTEICETDRVTGRSSLSRVGDDAYVAANYNLAAFFDGTSPSVGDAPVWTAVGESDSFYTYLYRWAEAGPSDTVFIGGSRTTVDGSNELGYLQRLTAAGNQVDSATTNLVSSVDKLAVSSDGSVVAATFYPEYQVSMFDSGFDQQWSFAIPASNEFEVAFDSGGNVIVAYRANESGTYQVRKMTSEGPTESLWSTQLPNGTRIGQLAVADDDSIWVSTIGFDLVLNFTLYKLAP